MTRPLVVLGASAYPEIAELIRDINAAAGEPVWQVRCLLDDDRATRGTEIEGIPVDGPLDLVHRHGDAALVLAIGSYRTRLARHGVIGRLGLEPERFATLVHPGAKVYSTASLGHGCIIHKGAVIANGARLGHWVIVLWNSVVGADNRVGDGALFTSNVTTNSGVCVGPYAFIGASSAVAEGVEIGPGAMVAMGSIVLRNVEPGAFQFGNPPRILSHEAVPDDVMAAWGRLTAKE